MKLSAKDDIIRLKDEEIERVKDMKLKMSVKEIGENLEKWCQNQFDMVRTTAFPHAYFEKDNESVKDEGEPKEQKEIISLEIQIHNGIEYISIMFEMKNKMDGHKRSNK